MDRAGCGKAVGVEDFADHHGMRQKANPWNFNEQSKAPAPTYAIDLSIWICESLTSSAIADNHADPTLHLVFTRTLKLLNLGIKVVGVLEGKSRLRQEGDRDTLQKRRSGTPFWRACERCEELYKLLGLPIVRAKVEGEALCALLNQRGVVDAIISNDGDCFLFGAKTLYTKFSIENLQQGKVMRYDADNLAACLDDDDSDACRARFGTDMTSIDVVRLNRNDLIVFAVLTGSDVAGSGFPKVGCRKALRFIRKCQIDNPLRSSTAASDEMMSWATSSTFSRPVGDCPSKTCSNCLHVGTKSNHKKNGCKICGTNPGEPCFQVSPGGKFRKTLRDKALGMFPAFDPKPIFNVYQSPNDKQLPFCFQGVSSKSILMKRPNLDGILKCGLIIRGRSHAESRKYLLQSLSRLIARMDLSCQYEQQKINKGSLNAMATASMNKAAPIKILKVTNRSSEVCYEVLWKIDASFTDSDGNPYDEFEFVTFEKQTLIKKCYPKLVEVFLQSEKERLKQGRTEQERRKTFLAMFTKDVAKVPVATESGENSKPGRKAKDNQRDYFSKSTVIRTDVPNRTQTMALIPSGIDRQKPTHMGDDVAKLLGHYAYPTARQSTPDKNNDSIQTSPSSLSNDSFVWALPDNRGGSLVVDGSPYNMTTTPSHVHFLNAPRAKSSSMLNDSKLRSNPLNSSVEGGLVNIKSASERECALINRRVQDPPSKTPVELVEAHASNMIYKSPFLKRTKPAFGMGRTPPLSQNMPLGSIRHYSNRQDSDMSLRHRDRGDYLDLAVSRTLTTLATNKDGVREFQDTSGDGENKAPVDCISPAQLLYSGISGKPDGSGNDPKSSHHQLRSLTSPDLDAFLLANSFADISIHSIPSIPSPASARMHQLWERSQRCSTSVRLFSPSKNMLDLPEERSYGNHDDGMPDFQPTSLFVDNSFELEIRPIDDSPGYPHSSRLEKTELVNNAMAKLENNTRLAGEHQQSDELLGEAMWQDDFRLFGDY